MQPYHERLVLVLIIHNVSKASNNEQVTANYGCACTLKEMIGACSQTAATDVPKSAIHQADKRLAEVNKFDDATFR